MVKDLLKHITFKQVTIFRGLLFSLLLLFSIKYDYTYEYCLYAYLGIFILRVLFNYNLEDYKYKSVPIYNILVDLDRKNVYFKDAKFMHGIARHTPDYSRKLSNSYRYLFWLSNFMNVILTFLLGVGYFFTGLDFILANLSIDVVAIVLIVSFLVYVVYLVTTTVNKTVKGRVKDNLIGK